jgi:hypothetical protein
MSICRVEPLWITEAVHTKVRRTRYSVSEATVNPSGIGDKHPGDTPQLWINWVNALRWQGPRAGLAVARCVVQRMDPHATWLPPAPNCESRSNDHDHRKLRRSPRVEG